MVQNMTEMIRKIEEILTTDGSHNAKPVVLEEARAGCFVCTSHKGNAYGYFPLKRNGKKTLAHRMIYEAFYDLVPEDKCVCHTCDHSSCLNPEHFFLGTQADNIQDMVKKGRGYRRFGKNNGNAKLIDEEVFDIIQKYGAGEHSQRKLARTYGVSQVQIWRIINDKNWKHLNNSTQIL